MWRQLGRRVVLLRLGLVCLTTLAVTLLVFLWGPPFTYQFGQKHPHDIHPRVAFDMIDKVEKAQQSESPKDAISGLPPGSAPVHELVDKASATETEPPLEKYSPARRIVQRNTAIELKQLAVLQEEHRVWLASLKTGDYSRRGFSLLLMFGLIGALVSLYVGRYQPGLAATWRSLVSICVLVFATVAVGLLMSRAAGEAVFLPLTITAMILTLAYNPQFSLVVSLGLTLTLVIALGAELAGILVMLCGVCALILLSRNVSTRTQLVRVACCAGIVYFVTSIATGLMTGQDWSYIVKGASWRFIWGTLAGFLLTGLLPIVERVFGVVTDISLREYADGSHPLLQELVRRAPGTYTHSITVATLAEAAAEAINANPLLVRAGSYFHDVGKMLKPQYFVENQNGENRHDALEPALSSLIIIGHVKDGVALAKQYNLPRPIIDFIEQHHGTTLVEYFYREALRLHGENNNNGEKNGHAHDELEASFRYPGPKPQYREVGVVMLADAVESASRALSDPTPARISKLVHDLLMKRLLDGQFEESGLTLSELHIVESALCKSLTALCHARIKYEEDDEDDKATLPVKAS